jgi:hypothetical protein
MACLMETKDHSKFSTPPRESLWWRANVTKEDLQWVRAHLGHGLDGLREFKAIPSPAGFSSGPLSSDWPGRVIYVEHETAPHIHIQCGQRYDYRLDYERAKRERDPYLSPHGAFRNLENGYHVHALQFMQQFGALTWQLRAPNDVEWVSLADFWAHHARFVGVSMLWEARSDDQLRTAWQWIYERIDQINRVAPDKFGYVSLWNGSYAEPPETLPWESEHAFRHANPAVLRETTFMVIENELNMHTADCRQIWMRQRVGDEPEKIVLRPTRGFRSLWGAIWDLFGRDASDITHSWRLCLECGRFFYPHDVRSVCCTKEHQALWSKRRWARENRKPKYSHEGI